MSKPIKDHAELKAKIRSLEESAKAPEDFLIREGQKALAVLSDPVPFIKHLAQTAARDKDLRKDLLKIGLSAGINSLGRLISSPNASDALLSFILKKNTGQPGSASSKAWNYLARLVDKLKPNKHQQA